MTGECGTRAKYQRGCHCAECTRANTRYQQVYRSQMAGTRTTVHGTTSGRTIEATQRPLPIEW